MNMNETSFNDLKGDLTENDVNEILAIVGKGCRDRNMVRLRSILTYASKAIPNYGILNRLVKVTRGSKTYWEYTAGQSYPDEIRTIREIILSRP